jgi:hypothetical protein
MNRIRRQILATAAALTPGDLRVRSVWHDHRLELRVGDTVVRMIRPAVVDRMEEAGLITLRQFGAMGFHAINITPAGRTVLEGLRPGTAISYPAPVRRETRSPMELLSAHGLVNMNPRSLEILMEAERGHRRRETEDLTRWAEQGGTAEVSCPAKFDSVAHVAHFWQDDSGQVWCSGFGPFAS